MAYTTIDNPELFFQTVLYTGNATARSITLDGSEDMQPDWVWCKNRDIEANNHLFDSVRGATKDLISNVTTAEATDAQKVTSFDSDGFSLGTNGNVNGNTNKQVAWCWKAGTSFSNDASATSVGTIDSTGSINTTAGFSIISYTGNGTLGATVAHGLGVAPSLVIVKRRDTTGNWWTYHSNLGGANKYIVLNSTSAAGTSTNIWNNTAPTSTVFSLGDNSNYPEVNGTSNTFIAYCFAGKKGYSKFGSYKGNGNADGTFIYTGFLPAWIMVKPIDATQNWQIHDLKRLGYNITNKNLSSNSTATEAENDFMDIVSNGFKIKRADVLNVSGDEYIYWAFAKAPFTNSNGVPTNAR